MELFRLFGTVLIDDKEAIQSLKNVDDKGKKTKTSLQDIADKGAKIGAAVLAGTGVAIGGLLAMASSTSDTAAHWLELSQRTDISIESLERWGYAAEQSGVNIDSLEVGMKKLSTNMQSAITDSGASRDAFEKLGISMDDLSKMSPEQTFDTIMNKLADMPDSADKNVTGNLLLGKSYTELKPLLSEGSDGMQDLKDQADKLGIVMSGESVTAAEGFGDTMDNVKATFDGVKNKLVMELIPQLTNMLNWFIDHSPQIQSVAETALGAVASVIGFISDNSNILIPVLAGLLGAFLAMQAISLVNGLMAAYTTFTTTATGVQIGLNAAMMANPIGIVIAAIAALIGIGVALYMNWDTIKEKATAVGGWISDKWDGIKTKTAEVWDGVKEKIGVVMDATKATVKENLENMKKAFDENGGGFKGTIAAAWEGIKGYFTSGFSIVDKLTGGKLTDIKNAFTDKMNDAKDAVSSAFENAKNLAASKLEAMKTSVSEKINAVKTSISTTFGSVKDIMTSPFETAKDTIKTVIDKVKGFLNFNWEFPKLKMPHFTVSGSMNPMKWVDEGVPKIGVSWYKNGGIFSKPTIFNTPYGLKGVGDAKSPEVVSPLSDLNRMISGEINKAIAPLYLNQNQDNPIIETGVYLNDDPIIKVKKRAQTQSSKRIGYTVATI